MTKKQKILILIFAVIVLAFDVFVFKSRGNVGLASIPSDLPMMTSEELAKYDGTDASQPIYLAMDGYVYDVTAGKEYYEPGAVYHYLAGKDSSIELKIAGGGIIRSKYKIVAKVAN